MTQAQDPLLAPVAAAVISLDSHVLLVRRRHTEGTLEWQLPAGKLRSTECPRQAAVREARQETGVLACAVKVLGERVHPDTGCLITYVACNYVSGEPYAAAPDEVTSAQWIPHDQIPRYIPAGLWLPVVRHLRTTAATVDGAVDMQLLTADVGLAREMAATVLSAERAAALQERLRGYITALADPSQEYGEGLHGQYQEVVLDTVRYAVRVVEDPAMEGADPTATLTRLAGLVTTLGTYVTLGSPR
ncbi:NUDIX hydrolase [Streptomyces qinzhouensis]|uniref:NUDIX hydrolase n=1 Tax=Streptomyces qinzhouensis TaxID=2599401 RepID=A0A5B8JGC3_9ACTN|nr:NUDIX hydrolase [Streptomyces qinzhouensis]QDY76790.1 NUDIX hydrolase [Streptomyces qinzhouensis]